jgi:hypothetical protein
MEGERRGEPPDRDPLVSLLDSLTEDLAPSEHPRAEDPAPRPAEPAAAPRSSRRQAERTARRRRHRRGRFLAVAIAVLLLVAAGALLLPGTHWFGSSHKESSPSAPGAGTPVANGKPRATQFGWPVVPKATSYRVRFFRLGDEVFQAKTVEPRIVLPVRWRFDGTVQRLTSGTYHWMVQPGFGPVSAPRYGKAIVDADWTARP